MRCAVCAASGVLSPGLQAPLPCISRALWNPACLPGTATPLTGLQGDPVHSAGEGQPSAARLAASR